MARPLTPLTELIGTWPDDAPQTLPDLFQLPPEDIAKLDVEPHTKNLLTEMRRHAVEMYQVAGRPEPMSSPDVILKMLRRRHIRPLAGKWLCYALNANRDRILISRGHKKGDACWLTSVHSRFPYRSQLPKIPSEGAYLIVYGGGPDILSEDDVPPKINILLDEAPVADIVFWHLTRGHPPAMYSLRAGVGMADGKRADLPHVTSFDPPLKPSRFAPVAQIG